MVCSLLYSSFDCKIFVPTRRTVVMVQYRFMGSKARDALHLMVLCGAQSQGGVCSFNGKESGIPKGIRLTTIDFFWGHLSCFCAI